MPASHSNILAPRPLNLIIILGIGLLIHSGAHAQTLLHKQTTSPNLWGSIGLNNIPSARMEDQGTIRAGLSTLDPYMHGWLSFQLADSFSVVLRQSAQTSSLTKKADSLYPGVDLKFRLLEETRSYPEIALGLQSTWGHKRMAGEYLALSKRYNNFDFTAGLGWGRLGHSAQIRNPLASSHRHFDSNRPFDGLDPSESDDWFTGQDAGFFAGIEYFTSFDGLSYKFDYFDDPYSAERASGDYDPPAPWSLALNYNPRPGSDFSGDFSFGLQGTDKFMARVSMRTNAKNWQGPSHNYERATPFRAFRTGLTLPAQMQTSAARDHIQLFDINAEPQTASARLFYEGQLSAPHQLGQAFTHMANHAGPHIEALNITPQIMNLRGRDIQLIRADLERAHKNKSGSAEEIWQNVQFSPPQNTALFKPNRPAEFGYGLKSFEFILDNQLSLSEEDSGELYRTSLLVKTRGPSLFGFLDNFASLRLNLKDNLYHLRDIRPQYPLPVRSDVADFADNRIAIDTLFSAYTRTLKPDLHLSLIGGYLEEMYAGAGGEILYRPFGKRWAIGAESWLAFKRDPDTFSAQGLNGDSLLTGHINGWYDIPKWDATLKASFGRYLAEDIGGSLALIKTFDNGARLEGFVSLSDQEDYDIFGGTTHQYHGVKLSLPLGGYKFSPPNARINLQAGPLGRNHAQRLDNPLPLYETTEPFSLQHISNHWNDITR